MAFALQSVQVCRVEANNAREERRLDQRITGHLGLETQQKIKVHQTEQECDQLRRDLAEMYFAEKRPKKKEQWSTRSLFDHDTAMLLMEERENNRRRRNRKLLYRAKQKDKLMNEMVKEFVTKLKNEASAKESTSNPVNQKEDELQEINEAEPDATKEDTLPELVSIYRSSSRVWNEARNTRYIRTKVIRDFEVELTAKEVFGDCVH